jgi:hypothetical protein
VEKQLGREKRRGGIDGRRSLELEDDVASGRVKTEILAQGSKDEDSKKDGY